MRTAIDLLVIENYALYKTNQKPLEGDANWQREFALD
jgi:carbamoyltransferase